MQHDLRHARFHQTFVHANLTKAPNTNLLKLIWYSRTDTPTSLRMVAHMARNQWPTWLGIHSYSYFREFTAYFMGHFINFCVRLKSANLNGDACIKATTLKLRTSKEDRARRSGNIRLMEIIEKMASENIIARFESKMDAQTKSMSTEMKAWNMKFTLLIIVLAIVGAALTIAIALQ